MTALYSEPRENERDLTHYIRVFKRRRWAIIGTTLLVTAMTAVFSLQQAKVYQASAQVLINTQDLASTVTGRPTDPSLAGDPTRFTTTQAALARSLAVATAAVESAKLPEESAGRLLANSTVAPNPNADILVFTVNDPDATNAATLARAYAAAYSAHKFQLDTGSLQRARDELTSRMKTLRLEGEQSSALYRTLASSEQQLHTMQLLQTPSTVITHPTIGTQIKPTPRRDAILGFGFGLVLGVAVAFVLEALDKHIRAEDDVERALGLPLLGRLPQPSRRLRQQHRLAMLDDPMSTQADAVRSLAANIELSSPDNPPRMLVVTSGVKREGKSTTAANLAVALARAGRRVALIDLDLRQPSVASLFALRRLVGLTNVVMGQSRLDEALVPVELEGQGPEAAFGMTRNGGSALKGGLFVLPSGPLPANPGEFVGAKALVTSVLEPLRDGFDYVIIDTPPLSVGADAATVASRADSLLVVARLGVIDRATLADVTRQVGATTAHAIGFVLTGIESAGDYGYGSGPQIPAADGSSVFKPTVAEGDAAGSRQRALP
jgi:Mrp family chromosome partitioning ATPase